MVIDMEIALSLYHQIKQAMFRHMGEHVVEKTDSSREVGRAGAVQPQGDRDVGLVGLASQTCGAWMFHHDFALAVTAAAWVSKPSAVASASSEQATSLSA